MGKETEEKPNSIMYYLSPDLLEEIFIGLPLKSILRFKSVSKEWRSIFQSKSFVERRRTLTNQKKPQILTAGDPDKYGRQFKGDDEVEVFNIKYDDATTLTSLACDGVVCIPEPGWINVLNPSTGEHLRFPSGPNPKKPKSFEELLSPILMDNFDLFPGYWAMGFGRDKVNGNYKVVRLLYDTKLSDILDVSTGEWRKLPNPTLPYCIEPRTKSAYVKGLIYWGEIIPSEKILVFDIHTEEFSHVPKPPTVKWEPYELINFEDRLGGTTTNYIRGRWALQIWIMNAQEKTWRKIYNISFTTGGQLWRMRCRPLVVSKRGNLYFYNSQKRLFKYYAETKSTQLIACVHVLSPFVENLIPIRSSNYVMPKAKTFFGQIPKVLLTITVVALVLLRNPLVSSRSRIER